MEDTQSLDTNKPISLNYVLSWIEIEATAKLEEQFVPNQNKTGLCITKHQTAAVGMH